MDKEEILKRGREDGPDEREQKIYCDAFNFAGTVCCGICLLFIIYSIFRQKSPYPYCLIAMAYCTAEKLYKYIKLRKKNDLLFGLITGIATVCWTVLFFLDF